MFLTPSTLVAREKVPSIPAHSSYSLFHSSVFCPTRAARMTSCSALLGSSVRCFGPIAKSLDTKTMTEMNAKVDVDGELPEDVAEDFLSENGFVE